jgi:two-component system sensor histidine kinase CiaH
VFASIGRRLAALNAVMVIAVIVLVGLGTALILGVQLNREESDLLQRRAESAATAWVSRLNGPPGAGAAPSSTPVDEHEDGEDKSDEHDNGHEALVGGDVVLYGVNRDGDVIVNERGFTFPGLPNSDSIKAALRGQTDERLVTVNGESVRIRSVPVYDASGTIAGAVQAARGQNQYQKQRAAVLYATLAGAIIGAIVAPLAGLFLARRAMRPIDASFSAQKAFVADASHELRTPLAVLRANAELIERMPDATPSEIRVEAEQMIAEIDEMTRLVNDLLFLARLDEGGPALIRHDEVELSAILEAEEVAHLPRIASAGLTLQLQIDAPVTVMGDPDRLRQVLRILLDNAVAYTPAGGTISVHLSTRGSEALIEVRDTGIGIPEADQSRVFDRFYRADRARARQSGGSGLGLSIAKTIVEAHHGTISLRSELGQGAQVSIRLPSGNAPSTGD